METLEDIRHSSDFYAGDQTSFTVKTPKYTLPGKYDPTLYLKKFNLNGKVLILFPSYGGLINEVSDLYETFYYEPRLQYKKGLSRILAVIKSPATEVLNINNKYDTAIWSEGFEQIPDPLTILDKVIENVSTLFIEIVHGQQEIMNGNSVRPTEQTFKKYLNSKNVTFEVMPGRLENRTIYKISKIVKQDPNLTNPLKMVDATVPIVEDPDSKQKRKKIKKSK